MNAPNPSHPDPRGCAPGILNALLAIFLTLVSFQYVRPLNCYRSCMLPEEGKPCLPGGCRIGEQKAGWPFPVFVDMPGGGSPTGGWGILGPEDLPSPLPLLLDVLFYSAFVWLMIYILNLTRGRRLHFRNILISLPLDLLLAAGLWLFYMLFPYNFPIGRGYEAQVYVNTSTDTLSSPAFSPTVPIRLEELIKYFGDPGTVWINTGASTARSTVLHWSSPGVYAELSPISAESFVIEQTTPVKRIIFSNEPDVLSLDGKLLGEKNIPWTGYGEYQP